MSLAPDPDRWPDDGTAQARRDTAADTTAPPNAEASARPSVQAEPNQLAEPTSPAEPDAPAQPDIQSDNHAQVDPDDEAHSSAPTQPDTATQLNAPAQPQAAAQPAAPAQLVPGVLIPHINVHCFAESDQGRSSFQAFAADKRMRRASVEVLDGGFSAAQTRYHAAGSPHLIVLECGAAGEDLIWHLDQLADVCDAGTQVVVVGTVNDIGLYRKLIDYGVSDYFVAPAQGGALVSTVERLFCDANAPKLGNLYAFIGAKGGVGSSTIAQNTAWQLADGQDIDVLLADMDLAFGTAALDFNVEHDRGMGEALREIDRLDDALLERLMVSRGKHLRLLSAPEKLDAAASLSEPAVETMLDVAQRNLPAVVLDLPHGWNDWIKVALTRADRVVVTATPTLPGMRNAVSLLEAIRNLRPNGTAPTLILNHVGARRVEISPKEVESTLGIAPECCIDFNPKLFGTAESKGLMIAEAASGSKVAKTFETLATTLSGVNRRRRRSGWFRQLLGR